MIRSRTAGISRVLPLAIPAVSAAACALIQTYHRFSTLGREVDLVSFLRQAETWENVFTWDHFNSFGYAFTLKLLQSLGVSGFNSAMVIAPLGLFAFLLVTYYVAREFLEARQALFAQILAAVNWHAFQFGVIAGPDILWAAIQCLSLSIMVRALRKRSGLLLAAAGFLTGAAYDLRQTALVAAPLLVFLWAWEAIAAWKQGNRKFFLVGALMVVAFFLAASPQIYINYTQKGSFFANGQAKNVWFGIYGQGNWTEKWEGVREVESLGEIIRQDPKRFAAHWAAESIKYAARIPFTAFGVQPVMMFNHASGWVKALLAGLYSLAGAGLSFLLLLALKSKRPKGWVKILSPAGLVWPCFILLYGAAVSMAFTTFRFMIVLIPVMASVMAAVTLWMIQAAGSRRLLSISLAFLIVGMGLHSGFGVYVYLTELQARGAEVEQALVRDGAGLDEPIATNRAAIYNTGSKRSFVPLPGHLKSTEQVLEWMKGKGIRYLLFGGPNFKSKEPDSFPDLNRVMFGDNPPGEVLFLRREYLPLVLIRLKG